MKIYKTTEKTYWKETTRDGKTVFRPPHRNDVPFKRVVTYGSDGKPFSENFYMSDGRLEGKYKLPHKKPLHTTETQTDGNGLVVYRKLEFDEEKWGSKFYIEYQDWFYEYKDGVLFRANVISHENQFMITDLDDGSWVVSDDLEHFVVQYEYFYNERGDVTKRLYFPPKSDELTHQRTYTYKYDPYGNMIYYEEIDYLPFPEVSHKKTYITIQYQE